ncbi:MAG: protein translocase subunit SecD [Anaerolineae bacterium]|nr:protein translocase subunit SecD [Anaerolineae bacterium]MDW8099235.1 protein translocase subunit SecD [Anaerolineae bacterium]
MRDRNWISLIAIVLLALVALYIALPVQHPTWLAQALFWQPQDLRSLELKLGLDLQGGLQVLLEADMPEGQPISRDAMDAARVIVEQRVNGLGVVEPLVQAQGDRRIIVELPGIEKPEQAIATLKSTGLLEFVDAGATPIARNVRILTDFAGGASASTAITATGEVTATTTLTSNETVTSTSPMTATGELTTTGGITTTAPLTGGETVTSTSVVTATGAITGTISPVTGTNEIPTITDRVFHTIMTGADLKDAQVQFDNLGRPYIAFELTEEGGRKFEEHTAKNIGRYLCITMDKIVISCPEIRARIGTRGIIEGGTQGFELSEARNLAVQMRYGALPVPLRVVDVRTIGPTLGQDSIQKSIRAGLIGVSVVLLFMLVYYRLPGLLADFALLTYAVLNLAIFKLVPVTLTLPGIAGFLLSTGMAVDANILIFERMKEELRAGRPLPLAVEAGFKRAWTAILDSNLSTIITCIILAWFGSNFGASMVKGFAINLGLGVLISMFTAVVATRTFMRAVLGGAGESIVKHRWLLGF